MHAGEQGEEGEAGSLRVARSRMGRGKRPGQTLLRLAPVGTCALGCNAASGTRCQTSCCPLTAAVPCCAVPRPQGGIHPDFTGHTYLRLLAAAKGAAPHIHVHAFSPLEVQQGAATLGWPLPRYLAALRDAGLGSLPGTAAEVLDDGVRAVLCPDKLSSAEWVEVVEAAHSGE